VDEAARRENIKAALASNFRAQDLMKLDHVPGETMTTATRLSHWQRKYPGDALTDRWRLVGFLTVWCGTGASHRHRSGSLLLNCPGLAPSAPWAARQAQEFEAALRRPGIGWSKPAHVTMKVELSGCWDSAGRKLTRQSCRRPWMT
jgi:hypothetical protein